MLAVRVELVGESQLHRKFRIERERIVQECQSVATGLSVEGVWIEKVVCNTRMPSLENEVQGVSEEAIQAILGVFEESKSNPDFLKKIQFDMMDLRAKLPSELRSVELDEYLDGASSVVELAKERVLELLASQGEESR